MTSLSDHRVRDFLSTGTRTGKIAWVAANGAPHVAPIWFVLDGDDLVFNTGSRTGKGRALAREGRASLVVDDQMPPYSFVKVDGTISISDDGAEVRRFAALIGGRYMGADRAEEYGERNGVSGELLVRLHPTKVTAAFDIADWFERATQSSVDLSGVDNCWYPGTGDRIGVVRLLADAQDTSAVLADIESQ